MKRAPQIRIVDDDPSVRDALSYMLELEGWDVAAYPDAWSFLNPTLGFTPL